LIANFWPFGEPLKLKTLVENPVFPPEMGLIILKLHGNIYHFKIRP